MLLKSTLLKLKCQYNLNKEASNIMYIGFKIKQRESKKDKDGNRHKEEEKKYRMRIDLHNGIKSCTKRVLIMKLLLLLIVIIEQYTQLQNIIIELY